jgi:hypothetical protein
VHRVDMITVSDRIQMEETLDSWILSRKLPHYGD